LFNIHVVKIRSASSLQRDRVETSPTAGLKPGLFCSVTGHISAVSSAAKIRRNNAKRRRKLLRRVVTIIAKKAEYDVGQF